MRLAMAEAELAIPHGDVPVGALVVVDGEVIASRHNERQLTTDPTAHAEVLAMRDACEHLGTWRLDNATLVSTLEPCAMCAGAMVHARLQTLVFGANEPRAGAVCSQQHFFESAYLNHHVVTRGGILAAASSARLKAFFKAKRRAPPEA